MSASLVSIIGPIGVGKTTLAEFLAKELPAQILYEDYEGNPFLADSYAGLEELILPAQLYFMMSRLKQLSDMTFPTEGIVVTDYGFCQDRMYAEFHLHDDDRLFYEHICRQVEFMPHQPAVIINLDAPLEILQARIKTRGRDYEQKLNPDLLTHLREVHQNFTPPPGCEMINIDCQQTDLLCPQTRSRLLDQINQILKIKV